VGRKVQLQGNRVGGEKAGWGATRTQCSWKGRWRKWGSREDAEKTRGSEQRGDLRGGGVDDRQGSGGVKDTSRERRWGTSARGGQDWTRDRWSMGA